LLIPLGTLGSVASLLATTLIKYIMIGITRSGISDQLRNIYSICATMTGLTVTEYLCHKWPRICSIYGNHNPVLSSFMTYHRVCN
jgi:hypothetical protein